VEAFSDGVFAIAATLLILNVQLPNGNPAGRLPAALLQLWPHYATYCASFLTIGIMWINHHALFTRITRVDRPLVLFNLGLLMVIAFVPFPTAVLGDHISIPQDASAATLFYVLCAVLTALAFTGVYLWVATHPELRARPFRDADFMKAGPWFMLGIGAYTVCLPLSFVSPPLVVLVVAGTAIYYVFDRLPKPVLEVHDDTQAHEHDEKLVTHR
jgi:uncharacterized membrane protein